MPLLPRVISNARGALRPAVHLGREAFARSMLQVHSRGAGPLVVFLPAGSAKGAALLRIYNIAGSMRTLGWRTAVLPARLTLAQRWRYLAAAGADVLVMQGARHALNRPKLYPGCPIVFDMDDADFHLPHLERPVTRAMGQVAAVIGGARYITDWAEAAGAPWARVVWTGAPVSSAPVVAHGTRPPVIAWAQTRPMTYQREADMVARVMARLGAVRPGITLRLYDKRPDDDPAFADRFRAPGVLVEWSETCSYATYLATFDDVALGLAPLCPETPFSRGKSFGKVLAYLDRGVPVIGSAAGEHEAFFTDATGVISNDEDQWLAALTTLIDNPESRARMAAAARQEFAIRLSVEAAARGVAEVLNRVLAEGRGQNLRPTDQTMSTKASNAA